MKNSNERIPLSFYEELWQNASNVTACAKTSAADSCEPLTLVKTILSSRNPKVGIQKEGVAILLQFLRQIKNPEVTDTILSASRLLREKIFGNRVATMVPIEISSFCMSNCHFCGWRSSNKQMLRLKISNETLVEQTRSLAQLGFSHFEISSGDDLSFIKNELPNAISLVKQAAMHWEPNARVSICLTPLLEEQYRVLKNHGLDTVLTWQETYSKEVFNNHVTSGPKENGITSEYKVDPGGNGYLARMLSHENAVRADLQPGLGVMIGLAPEPEIDILSVILHGKELIKNYQNEIKPLIIGMPTWNPITTKETDNLQNHLQPLKVEECFELIAAIYFLSLPDNYAWVFPNCRVSKSTQINSILTAGCFTSTMVRVGPGAYMENKSTPEINKAFVKSSSPGKNLTINDVLQGEQFIHHFDSHQNYIEAFESKGLTVVSDQSFIDKTLLGQE